MAVRQTYGFDNETCAEIDREFGEHPSCLPATAVESTEFAKLYSASEEELELRSFLRLGGGERQPSASTSRIGVLSCCAYTLAVMHECWLNCGVDCNLNAKRRLTGLRGGL